MNDRMATQGGLRVESREGLTLPAEAASHKFISAARVVDAQFEQPLLTKEAAVYVRVHRKTLERMARAGEVPAHRYGKKYYFFGSELDAWLRSKVNSTCQSVRVN